MKINTQRTSLALLAMTTVTIAQTLTPSMQPSLSPTQSDDDNWVSKVIVIAPFAGVIITVIVAMILKDLFPEHVNTCLNGINTMMARITASFNFFQGGHQGNNRAVDIHRVYVAPPQENNIADEVPSISSSNNGEVAYQIITFPELSPEELQVARNNARKYITTNTVEQYPDYQPPQQHF